MPDKRVVTVRSLAEEWGIDPSAARKYILACGATPTKLRDPSRGNQKVLCLTSAEAEALRDRRARESI